MSRENVVPELVMVDLIDMPHIEDDVKEEKRDQRYICMDNEWTWVCIFFFFKEWVCMDDDRKTHKVNNKSPVLHSLHYPAHLHLFVAPTININMHGYLTKIHTMILSLDMFVFFFSSNFWSAISYRQSKMFFILFWIYHTNTDMLFVTFKFIKYSIYFVRTVHIKYEARLSF